MHTKIAFFSDVHANLPAVRAALEECSRLSCDRVVVGGDVIGIGPQPRECLEVLSRVPGAKFVKGNHEWMTNPILTDEVLSALENVSEAEIRHTRWQCSQLTEPLRQWVARWPLSIRERVGGFDLLFVHYALRSRELGPREFPFSPVAGSEAETRATFDDFTASLGEPPDFVFFGHDHSEVHLPGTQGVPELVDPGSLGCSARPEARFATVDVDGGDFEVEFHAVGYDDTTVFRDFEERGVPERNFIYSAFFGGRFHPESM
ncbi:MAG: metallophosphoesterase family protein [Promethearchaeota archaeon]